MYRAAGGHIATRHAELCLITKQKQKVIVALWMSSLCPRPRHRHSAFWWHWRKRKERNSGKLLSSCHQICSNCTSECKRGREGVRVRGRCLLAQWQALNGCILPFLWGRTQTHIHTAIPGDSPQERPRNTTHHCLITPVPKDRREECRKVLPLTQNRRCTVYH